MFVNHAAFEEGRRHQQVTVYDIIPRQSAEQEDYQILAENIPSAFKDDCRIIQNKEKIDFWVEEKAKAWCKISKLLVNTPQLLFALSGNPSASSASNGTNTFEFFDDFEDYLDVKTLGLSSKIFASPIQLSNDDILVGYWNGSTYKVAKSTDGGLTFAYLSTIGAYSSETNIFLGSNGTIYVSSVGYFKKSTDNGSTWIGETTVGSGAGRSDVCRLSDGTLLYARINAAKTSIIIHNSSNDGVDWNELSTAISGQTRIEDIGFGVLSNGDILLQLEDEISEGGTAYLKIVKSINNGSSWSSPVTAAGDGTYDYEGGSKSFVEININEIWLIYTTDAGVGGSYSNMIIKAKKSTDQGDTWANEFTIMDEKPSMQASGLLLANGNLQIYWDNYPTQTWIHYVETSPTGSFPVDLVSDWTTDADTVNYSDSSHSFSGSQSMSISDTGKAHFDHDASIIVLRWRFYPTADDYLVLWGDGISTIYTKYTTSAFYWYNGNWHTTSWTLTYNQWNLLEYRNTNFTAKTYDVYLNGDLIRTGTTMRSDIDNINIVKFYGEGYTDDVLVRKYTSHEPLILKKRIGGKAEVIKAIVSGIVA